MAFPAICRSCIQYEELWIENRQLIKELGRGDSWIPYGSSQWHTHP